VGGSVLASFAAVRTPKEATTYAHVNVDQPGQSVVIRSGEAVAVTPSTTSSAQPGVAVQPSQPGSTVVVTQQPASVGPQQTLYGRVTDMDRREILIKSDNGSFEMKLPRDVTSQVRKGDTVRMDLTFPR